MRSHFASSGVWSESFPLQRDSTRNTQATDDTVAASQERQMAVRPGPALRAVEQDPQWFLESPQKLEEGEGKALNRLGCRTSSREGSLT